MNVSGVLVLYNRGLYHDCHNKTFRQRSLKIVYLDDAAVCTCVSISADALSN